MLTLGIAIWTFGALLWIPAPHSTPPSAGGGGDVTTFEGVVKRLRAGESYYPTFGDELRWRGYPARSIFNWRTPMHLSLLARMPDIGGRIALAALGVLLVLATFVLTAHERLWVAGGNVMQAGAVVPVLASGGVFLGEVWAGLLVGLSVYCFARRQTAPAVLFALAALFLRELAAPYCIVCTLAALARRRWRELGGWLAGACAYGVYYAWHAVQVWQHQLPTDGAHAASWLSAGGLTSMLTMARWHAWLLPSPPWATALALAVVSASLVAAATPLHAKLGVGVYFAFFMAAGQSFNGYWGYIAWPGWALASGYGLQALVDAAGALVKPMGGVDNP